MQTAVNNMKREDKTIDVTRVHKLIDELTSIQYREWEIERELERILGNRSKLVEELKHIDSPPVPSRLTR